GAGGGEASASEPGCAGGVGGAGGAGGVGGVGGVGGAGGGLQTESSSLSPTGPEAMGSSAAPLTAPFTGAARAPALERAGGASAPAGSTRQPAASQAGRARRRETPRRLRCPSSTARS